MPSLVARGVLLLGVAMPRRVPTSRWLVIVACAVVSSVSVGGSCGGDDGRSAAAPGLVVRDLRYRTEWVWGDAVPQAHGFRVVTDRGTTIEVAVGYLVVHGLSLVPCRPAPRAALSIGLPSAHAGHDGTRDRSAIGPYVESLGTPVTVEHDRLTLRPTRYCQLHYLVARADARVRGLPPDVNMARISLHLEGTYQLAGESAGRPFTVRTTMANGRLIELSVPDGGSEVSAAAVEVTVRRSLARLFDGIDFATATEVELAHAVLSNLLGGTVVTWARGAS